MCEGEYINKSPTWGFPIWEVGRETGLEPATTGITIPPQLRCLHPAEAGRGRYWLFFQFELHQGYSIQTF